MQTRKKQFGMETFQDVIFRIVPSLFYLALLQAATVLKLQKCRMDYCLEVLDPESLRRQQIA